jgi:hypothetical protein
MPTDLDRDWDSMLWPHRYMTMSFEVNAFLSKQPFKKSGKHWTKKDILEFMEWANKQATTLQRARMLYRGTPKDVTLPYYASNPTLSFVSTTKSADIAQEFASPKGKGWVHVLHLSKGCRVIDLQPYYATFRIPGLKREKEVLLLPGHTFTLLSEDKHTKHWQVEPVS